MQRLIQYLIFTILIILSPFLTSKIFACSCFPLPSIYDAFEKSDFVFVGKILSSEKEREIGDTDDRYRVQIIENFKGLEKKEVIVSAGSKETSCYWGGYTLGHSYLIYGHKIEDSTELSARRACSRTTNLENAHDQIIFIRELLSGKPESKVYGRAVFAENSLAPKDLAEIKIIAKSANRIYQTTTDKNGIYRFNKLAQGTYRLESKPPLTYRPIYWISQDFVVLKNGKICRSESLRRPSISEGECDYEPNVSNAIYFDFTLVWNNEIIGNVFGSDGKIIEKRRVRLLPLEIAKNIKDEILDDYNNTKYDFQVGGKKTGQYVLVVEIPSPLGKNNKLTYFYPATKEIEKAKIFNLTATTKLKLEFKLPEIKQQQILGHLIKENGRTVRGRIAVTLDSSDKMSENTQFDYVVLNDFGTFRFNALVGEEYWIHIWNNDVKQFDKASLLKSIKIKVENEEKIREIVLPNW